MWNRATISDHLTLVNLTTTDHQSINGTRRPNNSAVEPGMPNGHSRLSRTLESKLNPYRQQVIEGKLPPVQDGATLACFALSPTPSHNVRNVRHCMFVHPIPTCGPPGCFVRHWCWCLSLLQRVVRSLPVWSFRVYAASAVASHLPLKGGTPTKQHSLGSQCADAPL